MNSHLDLPDGDEYVAVYCQALRRCGPSGGPAAPWRSYLQFDEFGKEGAGLARQLLQPSCDVEGPMNFPPTHPFCLGTNDYDFARAVPTWRDRVFFRQGALASVRCEAYEAVPALRTSSHRPVFARISVAPAGSDAASAAAPSQSKMTPVAYASDPDPFEPSFSLPRR